MPRDRGARAPYRALGRRLLLCLALLVVLQALWGARACAAQNNMPSAAPVDTQAVHRRDKLTGTSSGTPVASAPNDVAGDEHGDASGDDSHGLGDDQDADIHDADADIGAPEHALDETRRVQGVDATASGELQAGANDTGAPEHVLEGAQRRVLHASTVAMQASNPGHGDAAADGGTPSGRETSWSTEYTVIGVLASILALFIVLNVVAICKYRTRRASAHKKENSRLLLPMHRPVPAGAAYMMPQHAASATLYAPTQHVAPSALYAPTQHSGSLAYGSLSPAYAQSSAPALCDLPPPAYQVNSIPSKR